MSARIVEDMIQQDESILLYHDSYICRASAEGKALQCNGKGLER